MRRALTARSPGNAPPPRRSGRRGRGALTGSRRTARRRWLALTATATALGAALAWHSANEPARTLLRYRVADAAVALGGLVGLPGLPGHDTLLLGSSSIRRLPLGRPTCGALLNRGIGSAGIEHVQRYLDGAPRAVRAERIVVYAGENDLARGRTPADVAADYAALLERLLDWAPRDGVHVLAIKPSPRRIEHRAAAQQLNAMLRRHAESRRGLHLHDARFEDASSGAGAPGPRAAAFVADGVHLSAAGYDVFLKGLERRCR